MLNTNGPAVASVIEEAGEDVHPSSAAFRTRDNSQILRFQPYTSDLCYAVAEFNRRISPVKPSFFLPADPRNCWLPKREERAVYQEIYLAIQGETVRGGYTLKQQPFSFSGRVFTAAACQMPISEGIADRHYGFAGPRILRDAVRRQPLLFGLGIGSLDANITRLERAMGWELKVIPFYFKVRNGFRFFRNIEYLKTTPLRRFALNAAAFSGLGWAAARVASRILPRGCQNESSVSAEEAANFSIWGDEVWEACQERYSMTAVRNARVLNLLYPPGSPRFIRVKVVERGRAIGWAVLLNTAMSGSKYFGNMRVGTIVDCLALPENAGKVIRAAAQALERRDVDLLISNQSHPAWCRGLADAGFIEGPSNFLLTLSQQIVKLLDSSDPERKAIHMNRADGDGPIHL
ncbi:MAG TPA: hypothetical protein VFW83_08340 [Bryobacteraceae bacterium]|nr:hypothetical protein [Bryobacteraceae bacterium]